MARKDLDNFKPRNFALDVDGVLTTGEIFYGTEGKTFKVFGPDDHDALNMLRDKLNIFFLTADRRGFDISKKRVVGDMNFDLHLVSPGTRVEWLRNRVKLDETIFMGDGIFDFLLFREVGYSICPNNGFPGTRDEADFVTKNNGGQRAVAEACAHILEKFFGINELSYTRGGVWKDES